MKNPAEKATALPNRNVTKLIAWMCAVMESGFILITNRHTGCDCRAPFLEDSNRKPGLVRCRPNGFLTRRRRHFWRNVAFCQLAIPGGVRPDDEPTKRQGFRPAIGFHGRKCKPENRAGPRCHPRHPCLVARCRETCLYWLQLPFGLEPVLLVISHFPSAGEPDLVSFDGDVGIGRMGCLLPGWLGRCDACRCG